MLVAADNRGMTGDAFEELATTCKLIKDAFENGADGTESICSNRLLKKKREGKRIQRPRRNRGCRTPDAVDTGA